MDLWDLVLVAGGIVVGLVAGVLIIWLNLAKDFWN